MYRIKHIPTGLYFCQLRGITIDVGFLRVRVKTNLSEEGKTYSSKPTLAKLGETYCSHVLVSKLIEGLLAEDSSLLGFELRAKRWKVQKREWSVEPAP